ncbi:hypothetical protein Hypma_011398 [Hypsizygus marmoreus]|uniref:Peptidase S9 prolyl oligopeptidase catalytic domain-containing protein n=1 Tax=Hypsizygus marmoreus TaxID=39966 RepID=A0A369JGL6_HYPMA|nr:hypothetical protein Hypma_011398 [Hypsizygus marmoreus]
MLIRHNLILYQLFLHLPFGMAQQSALSDDAIWRVELNKTWDVLGPFPIHAREQHYLSPSFPLNLSEPINLNKSWPSSYGDDGKVSWSKAESDANGTLSVSFPNIRWQSLRATEGWAALQHHAVLRTQLTVYPPRFGSAPFPGLLIQLIQGSFFSILPIEPAHCEQHVAEWMSGNIYDMERALPRIVELPFAPSLDKPTAYNIFISGDYEIRLFGDPAVKGSTSPVQTIRLTVDVKKGSHSLMHEPSQDVLCDFVDGFAFGEVIGMGFRSLSGWWTIKKVKLVLPHAVLIAPSQTRTIPVIIIQEYPFLESQLQVEVTIASSDENIKKHTISLPISHIKHWTDIAHEPIRATYLYALTTPTVFVIVPPVMPSLGEPHPPILALHGAGVDVIDQCSWIDYLPRRRYNWIIIPTGRTSWGLDWHGPSARDAWAAVDALCSILQSKRQWHGWQIQRGSKVAIMGHSNGGQGAWYLASRYPDRVLGVVPAAAYIKSQAYVPLSMSRSAHYIDPALRTILESSLTPDDNDLYLSNLVDIPVLAIHGGNDENVPVWHSREAMSILQTRGPNANANVIFHEDPGQGHWYPSVFDNEHVQTFMDSVLSTQERILPASKFTLTVSVPSESGSLHGWKIESLLLPGRLARLQIDTDEFGITKVLTLNVHSFSVDLRLFECRAVHIGESMIPLPADQNTTLHFNFTNRTMCEVMENELANSQPPSRIQDILLSPGPITFVVPDTPSCKGVTVALRLAHDLNVYHKLDSNFLLESTAVMMLKTETLPPSNTVFIGHPSSTFPQIVLDKKKTPFAVKDSHLLLNDIVLDDTNGGRCDH